MSKTITELGNSMVLGITGSSFGLLASLSCAVALDDNTCISPRILPREREHCVFKRKTGSGMRVTRHADGTVFVVAPDVSQSLDQYDDDGEGLTNMVINNGCGYFLRIYAFVWPAASLLSLIILLLLIEGTTLGQEMTQEVVVVTRNVSRGGGRIPACRDSAFISVVPQRIYPGLTLHDAHSAACHDRGSLKKYSMHIDGSLQEAERGWGVLGITFSGLVLLMGGRPYFGWYGQFCSTLFRYGIPTCRRGLALEVVKTTNDKQEEGHE